MNVRRPPAPGHERVSPNVVRPSGFPGGGDGESAPADDAQVRLDLDEATELGAVLLLLEDWLRHAPPNTRSELADFAFAGPLGRGGRPGPEQWMAWFLDDLGGYAIALRRRTAAAVAEHSAAPPHNAAAQMPFAGTQPTHATRPGGRREPQARGRGMS